MGVENIALIASAFIVAVALVSNSTRNKKRPEGAPPIAPYGYPFIGHVLIWVQGPEATGQKLFEGVEGDIVEMNVFGFPFYLLRGQEYARKVLTTSHLNTRFVNPVVLEELDIKDKGLLLNNNIETWKRNRKILVESIGRPRFLRSLAPKVNHNLEALFPLLDQLDEKSLPFLANVLFGSISLDVIFDIIFSEYRQAAETYLKSLVNESATTQEDEVLDLLHAAFEATQFFVRTPKVFYKLHPTYVAKAKRLKKAGADWVVYVNNLVQQKKDKLDLESETTDLATTLLQGDGTLDEISQVVRETIGGGTDTSSNTMAFMTYELARNPAIADAIYNEIIEIVGEDGELTAENIGQLKYLEATIYETTRLYAVARFGARHLKEEVDLGEYKLRKGGVALVGIQLNHNYSKLWDNVAEFNPDRFLESKDLGGPLGFGFSYLAFGYGVRKCPGEALALTEMKLVMANLIRRYSFVLAKPEEPLKVKKDSLTLECLDLPNKTSYFQNGSKGVFIPPIRKLQLFYNHNSGDSRGMVNFMHTHLIPFATALPHVEIQVSPRKGAPAEIQAFYVGGQVRRHVCYRLDADTIQRHAQYLCDTNAVGEALEVVVEKKEDAEEGVVKEWVRRRKTPRNQTQKFQDINLKTTGETDFKPHYWKHVKQTNWKTVGRPADRKYTWPVLSGGQPKEHYWSPFTAEETFKP
ncbi:cytochrome P450 [Obelidium mucronatum]|nr:cytochrome P450 [Obelidium mucronatum]